MAENRKLYFTALGISFLGSLPVGTLNASIAGLAANHQWQAAIEFSVGAIGVEIGLVRIAVVTVRKLEQMKHLFQWFGAITCTILFLLAGFTLKAAIVGQPSAAVFPMASHRPFLAGLILSILNPLHLPFWLGWTAVLKAKKLLSDTAAAYNIYVAAIGSGTALAFLVYGIAGDLLVDFLKMRQNWLNWAVGLALLGTGLFQTYRLFIRRKGQ